MADKSADVRGLLEAFWAGDWDRTMQYFANDAVYEDPLLPEPVRGKAAILDVFKYCHTWGRITGEIRNLFGTDEFVVAELRICGTIIEPLEGLPDNVIGKAFDFTEADVFQFGADGKVHREAIYPDVMTLMRQLGQSVGPQASETGGSEQG